MGKTSPDIQAPLKRDRVVDLVKKPANRPVTLGLPRSFTTIIDAADDWPYPDPDADNTFGAVVSFSEYQDRDPDLSVEPYSEDEPWGRMATETPRDYDMFSYYRSLGITRQKTQVAEKFGLTRNTIAMAAHKRNWDARCRAWDEKLERIYTTELILGVKEMAAIHAEKARAGIEALSVVFTAIQEQVSDPTELAYLMDEIKTLPIKTQMAMAKGAAQVMPNLMGAERLARGLPTELTAAIGLNEHRVTIQSVDDLATIISGLAPALVVAQSDIIETEAVEPDD